MKQTPQNKPHASQPKDFPSDFSPKNQASYPIQPNPQNKEDLPYMSTISNPSHATNASPTPDTSHISPIANPSKDTPCLPTPNDSTFSHAYDADISYVNEIDSSTISSSDGVDFSDSINVNSSTVDPSSGVKPEIRLKYCSTCWSDQPVSNFLPDPKNSDGLMRLCKPCRSQGNKRTENRNYIKKGRSPDYNGPLIYIRSCIVHNQTLIKELVEIAPMFDPLDPKAVKILGFCPQDPDTYAVEAYIERTVFNIFIYRNDELTKAMKYPLSVFEPEDVAFELEVLLRGMKVRLERNEYEMEVSKNEIYPYTKVGLKWSKKIAVVAVNYNIKSRFFENKATSSEDLEAKLRREKQVRESQYTSLYVEPLKPDPKQKGFKR